MFNTTLLSVGLCAIVLTLCSTPSAVAYTPEDPVVQQMVGRGLKWLESYNKPLDDGQQVLIAYAHFKVEHNPTHPLVEKGIVAARRIVRANGGGKNHEHKANYETAISVLFLAAIDPIRYKPELEILQNSVFVVQSPNGCFTYHNEKKGDISQTQYMLLAIWTLDRAGIPLDYQRVIGAMQWLMRAQDPTGGWPYHAAQRAIERLHTSHP